MYSVAQSDRRSFALSRTWGSPAWAVALIAIWLNVSELFGVFGRQPGPIEAIPSRFNDCGRDQMQVIYAENALDLGKEASQKSEISSCHPNQARDHIWKELFIWQMDTCGHPSTFKQVLNLRCIEWTELVYCSFDRQMS